MRMSLFRWQSASLLFLLALFLSVEASRPSLEAKETKKYTKKVYKKAFLQYKPYKHKETEAFVKKLEYDAGVKEGQNALDYGLTPIDLNLLQDEEFAEDVVDGIEQELTAIDQEFGESENSSTALENETSKSVGPLSLMHQGMYTPSPEFNLLIDGLVENVKKDIGKREMDPLHFAIHNRGIVRHSSNRNSLRDLSLSKQRENTTVSSMPLGVGMIKGLSSLKRFGNAESRKDGDVTLVRSHYFFGPLTIDLIFGSMQGIHIINTTLSSLAAHALVEVSNEGNSKSLKEFLTDSPMEYEIRLRGAKNRRFRTLSQSSIARLFKRGGRMEVRLKRSFARCVRQPIDDVDQNKEKEKKKKKKNKKDRMTVRKP